MAKGPAREGGGGREATQRCYTLNQGGYMAIVKPSIIRSNYPLPPQTKDDKNGDDESDDEPVPCLLLVYCFHHAVNGRKSILCQCTYRREFRNATKERQRNSDSSGGGERVKKWILVLISPKGKIHW